MNANTINPENLDDFDTDGFTMQQAYEVLEARLRYSDPVRVAEEIEDNPARSTSSRDLANYVGETWDGIQGRFEADGTLF